LIELERLAYFLFVTPSWRQRQNRALRRCTSPRRTVIDSVVAPA
jgi:hypothetical protein